MTNTRKHNVHSTQGVLTRMIVWCLLVGTVSLGLGSPIEPVVIQDGDILKHLKLGSVPAHSRIALEVPLKNTRPNATRIVFETADCGCLSALKNGLLIKQGDGDVLKLTLDVDHPGTTLNRMARFQMVDNSGVNSLELRISVDVSPPVIDPPTIKLGALSSGEIWHTKVKFDQASDWELLNFGQLKGPTELKLDLIQGDSSDATGGHVAVVGNTSAMSSDLVLWSIGFNLKRKDGLTITSKSQITGSIPNHVFKPNTLYLGTVRKSKKQQIERRFELKKGMKIQDLQIKQKKDEKGGSISVKADKKDNQFVLVHAEFNEEIPFGMNTFHLKVGSFNEYTEVFVPVRFLVLP